MLLPPRPTHFPYTTLFRSAVPRIRRDRQSGHSRLRRDFAHAHADVVLAFSADGSGVTQARPIQSGMRAQLDRKSTRLNSSHVAISYAVFCLKKKTLRRLWK